MTKTYKIKFREYEKEEEQILEVKTKDIDFTVEQIHRNKNIEKIEVSEIEYPVYDDDDIQGPNGNLGI